MILPSKHISLSESLLGLAGILLTFLAKDLIHWTNYGRSIQRLTKQEMFFRLIIVLIML